jgi:hypothetical protein
LEFAYGLEQARHFDGLLARRRVDCGSGRRAGSDAGFRAPACRRVECGARCNTSGGTLTRPHLNCSARRDAEAAPSRFNRNARSHTEGSAAARRPFESTVKAVAVAVLPSVLEPAMINPRTTFFDVDWNAAHVAAASFDQPTTLEEKASAPVPDLFVSLNAATSKFFPKASANSVPVPLPLDTPAYVVAAYERLLGERGRAVTTAASTACAKWYDVGAEPSVPRRRQERDQN